MTYNKREIWNSTYKSVGSVLRWAIFALTMFWAILIFALGNIAGGIFSVIFAAFVCPHMDKLFRRFEIYPPRYIMPAIRVFLGILAFAVSLIFTETSSNSATSVPETETVSIETKTESVSSINDNTEIIISTDDEEEPSSEISFEEEESVTERIVYPNLEVHFIDVGQGDCTLLICDGQSMLIDCGPEDSGTKIQLYLKKHGITKLDYLVLTHPDADHIGGADVIITKFDIDNLFMLNIEKDTKTYRNVMDSIEYRGFTPREPEVGETFNLGEATIRVVGPVYDYEEINNMSISLKVSLGETSYLLIGDAENEAQYDMAIGKTPLKANVYKAGHHGSRSSLNLNFLSEVLPEYTVISCGVDNQYGHPHSETLRIFEMLGSVVYRTDQNGTIVSISDGYDINWEISETVSE